MVFMICKSVGYYDFVLTYELAKFIFSLISESNSKDQFTSDYK